MTQLFLDSQIHPSTLCVCGNCDWTGGAEDLEGIVDAQERLTPGSPVPAGQCPRCGALAYIAEEPEDTPREFFADRVTTICLEPVEVDELTVTLVTLENPVKRSPDSPVWAWCGIGDNALAIAEALNKTLPDPGLAFDPETLKNIAQDLYQTDTLNIEDNQPRIRADEDGVWIQAWVYLSNEDIEDSPALNAI